MEESREVMERLARLGIDMDRVTADLVDEGIEKFNKPFDELIASLDRKRAELAGDAGS
ncbi:MAG: hypothetical protein ACE5ID_07095 [Acidobacteriota bacterium]